MATLAQNNLGLVALAQRTGNKNAIAIAEVLDEVNELQDAVWVEANSQTSHKVIRRSELPSGSWRQINDGVATESSKTVPFFEAIGLLESFSQVDEELAKPTGNIRKFRADEDRTFIEGMGQTLADTLVYGNMNTIPESFNGVKTRYNLTSLANVTGASGTGDDTTSVIVIQWGPKKAHFTFPLGSSSVGLEAEDMGIQLVPGATSGTKMRAYVTHFIMRVGLAVQDDRCVQIIANIETAGSSNIFDEDLLIASLNRLPDRGRGAAIYANQTVKTQMDIIAKDQSNVNYQPGQIGGISVTTFKGFPVRQLDSILDTETAIS